MNTFKTTACVLLLTTAGFAMENDGAPPHTPVHTPVHHVVTPVQQGLGALHVGTPPHGIQPQQLFANTPEHVQQHVQFVTPQDQMIQQVTPGAPVAARLRFNAITPDADRLVGSVTSSPPLPKKRKSVKDTTILDPKGNVVFTTAKKKGRGSDGTSGYDSPADVATGLSYFDRLETDAYTPAVHSSMRQFTTGKNMRWVGEEDPITEDVHNEYLPAQVEASVGVNDESVVSANYANETVLDDSMGSFVLHGAGLGEVVVQDDSMGSFVIHGANLLNNSADNSVLDDSLFHIHGANPLGDGVDNSDDEDDTMSVIANAELEGSNYLDMGDGEIDLSDEE